MESTERICFNICLYGQSLIIIRGYALHYDAFPRDGRWCHNFCQDT